MSPLGRAGDRNTRSFPRVSGDEPYWPTGGQDYATFSPREWG